MFCMKSYSGTFFILARIAGINKGKCLLKQLPTLQQDSPANPELSGN